MDFHNDKPMTISQIRAEIGNRKVVVGAKQLRKALQNGGVFRVYIALNADPRLTEPLMALCETQNVDCACVKTMAELGQACGIEVGAAAAAVLN